MVPTHVMPTKILNSQLLQSLWHITITLSSRFFKGKSSLTLLLDLETGVSESVSPNVPALPGFNFLTMENKNPNTIPINMLKYQEATRIFQKLNENYEALNDLTYIYPVSIWPTTQECHRRHWQTELSMGELQTTFQTRPLREQWK